MNIPIFPGKYHQNGGFSSQRFVSLQEGNVYDEVDIHEENEIPKVEVELDRFFGVVKNSAFPNF